MFSNQTNKGNFARLFQHQEAGEVHGLEGVGVARRGRAVGARGDRRGRLRHRHHRLPARYPQLYALGMFRFTIFPGSGLYLFGIQLKYETETFCAKDYLGAR